MSIFKQVMRGVLEQEVVIPVLNAQLYDPNFKSFDVPMEKFKKRVPDGWFHPSEHPLWPERQLYFYVAFPHEMVRPPMDPLGTQAVTAGNFWHAFVQTLGIEGKWLKVMNPKGKTAHDKAEYWVEDPVLGRGGSMDGVLNPEILNIPTEEGFELKTMNQAKLSKCPRAAPMDELKIAWFRDSCTDYYAQAQEYLSMSGYLRQRVVLMSPDYPYPKVEICVPYDRAFSSAIVDKYRRVRQAVAEDYLFDPCCGWSDLSTQRDCPAQGVCPIALKKV